LGSLPLSMHLPGSISLNKHLSIMIFALKKSLCYMNLSKAETFLTDAAPTLSWNLKRTFEHCSSKKRAFLLRHLLLNKCSIIWACPRYLDKHLWRMITFCQRGNQKEFEMLKISPFIMNVYHCRFSLSWCGLLYLGSVHFEHEASFLPLYCYILYCFVDVAERGHNNVPQCETLLTKFVLKNFHDQRKITINSIFYSHRLFARIPCLWC